MNYNQMPSGVIGYIRKYNSSVYEEKESKFSFLPYFLIRLGNAYELMVYFDGDYIIYDCYGKELSKEHLPKRISSIADAKEVFDHCENLPKCV
jgi:hypothetical protein